MPLWSSSNRVRFPAGWKFSGRASWRAPCDEDQDMDELERITTDAAEGDPLAAAALVRATQSDVWRLCAALGDGQNADDLTQETYLRAFGALHRFEHRSSVRTWLLSIARRVCADSVRSRRRWRCTSTSRGACANARIAISTRMSCAPSCPSRPTSRRSLPIL